MLFGFLKQLLDGLLTGFGDLLGLLLGLGFGLLDCLGYSPGAALAELIELFTGQFVGLGDFAGCLAMSIGHYLLCLLFSVTNLLQ